MSSEEGGRIGRGAKRSRTGAPTGAQADDVDVLQPTAAQRVRFTLDLAREQHRFLKHFALDAEVDASVVVRVLLLILQEDEALAERVLQRLAAS